MTGPLIFRADRLQQEWTSPFLQQAIWAPAAPRWPVASSGVTQFADRNTTSRTAHRRFNPESLRFGMCVRKRCSHTITATAAELDDRHQECLTNVDNHSGATELCVRMDVAGERVRMVGEDDSFRIPENDAKVRSSGMVMGGKLLGRRLPR